MKAPAEYLEAAKIQEIASNLTSDGYRVSFGGDPGENGYDLTAYKNNEKLAIEVKAQSRLKESLNEIRDLRQHADEEGITDFRLVIVNPPREKTIEIAGLDETIYDYLLQNYKSQTHKIARHVRLEAVAGLEINFIRVDQHNINVRGTAAVEMELNDAEPDKGLQWKADCLLEFDLVLNRALDIVEAQKLHIDLSDLED